MGNIDFIFFEDDPRVYSRIPEVNKFTDPYYYFHADHYDIMKEGGLGDCRGIYFGWQSEFYFEEIE